MAWCAADLVTQIGTVGSRAGGRSKHGRSQEAHEARKLHHIAGRGRFELGVIFRSSIENAPRSFIALRIKDLIGYTLFNVVCFTRKKLQRLVLRLPPDSSDRAVVAVEVWVTINAQGFASRPGWNSCWRGWW